MRATRILIPFCCLVAGAALGQGQEATVESLTAARVNDRILFSVHERTPNDTKKTEHYLKFTLDDQKKERVLGPARTFLATDDLRLLVKEFNPLLYRITTKTEEFEDPAFAAIRSFSEAVKKFQEAVGGVANELGALKEAAVATKRSLTEGAEGIAKRLSAQPTVQPQASLELPCMEELQTLIASLDRAKELLSINESDDSSRMKGILAKSTGAVGVQGAKSDLAKWKGEIKTTIAAIDKELQAIAKLPDVGLKQMSMPLISSSAPAAPAASPLTVAEEAQVLCYRAVMRTIALSTEVAVRYERGIAALTTMAKALGALEAILAEYGAQDQWEGDNYCFLEYVPDDEKGMKVDLKLAKLKLAGKGPALDPEWETSSVLRLRHYQAIVPEIGAGLFYSPLEVPKYGTKETDDGVVVGDAGMEPLDGGAAVFLNLVYRWRASTFVYPGFQLGVGTGADSPSIAAGVVLRFPKASGFSLSCGRVLTWYKDLDTLKPGDPITGTADIEKDLKRTTKDDWYVAILYNWTIGKDE